MIHVPSTSCSSPRWNDHSWWLTSDTDPTDEKRLMARQINAHRLERPQRPTNLRQVLSRILTWRTSMITNLPRRAAGRQ